MNCFKIGSYVKYTANNRELSARVLHISKSGLLYLGYPLSGYVKWRIPKKCTLSTEEEYINSWRSHINGSTMPTRVLGQPKEDWHKIDIPLYQLLKIKEIDIEK